MGSQNGGWTIAWQGLEGNEYFSGDYKTATHATSLLDGIKTRFDINSQLLYVQYDSRTDMNDI